MMPVSQPSQLFKPAVHSSHPLQSRFISELKITDHDPSFLFTESVQRNQNLQAFMC